MTSDDRDDETATKQGVTYAVAHADLTLEQRVDATLARPAPFVPADSEPRTLEPNFTVRGLGARGGRLEDAPTGRLEDAPTARRGASLVDEEEKATKQFDSRGILEAFDASLEASSRTLQRPAAGQRPAASPPDAEQEGEDEETMLHARPLDDAELDGLEPTELAPNATAVRLGGAAHPALGEQPTVSIITSAAGAPLYAIGERGLPVFGGDPDEFDDPDEFGSKGGTKKIVITPEDVAELRRGAPPRGAPQSSGAQAVGAFGARAPSALGQGNVNVGPMRAGASTVPLMAPRSADARGVAGEPMSQGAQVAHRAPPRVASRPEPVAALMQPQTGGGAVPVLAPPRPRGRAGRIVLVLVLLVASVGAGAFYVKRRGAPAFVTRLLKGRASAAAPAAVAPAASAASASSEAPASPSASSLLAGADSSSPLGAPPSSSSSSPLSTPSPSASPSTSSSSHRGGAHPPRPRAPKPAPSKPPTP